jgi:hypothetical protein
MKRWAALAALLGLLSQSAEADIAFYGGGSSRVVATTGQASVTGTTAETNLASLKIPANSMGKNGVVEVVALWSYTNSANVKSLFHRLGVSPGIGGTTVVGTIGSTATATAQSMVIVRNNNAANAQVAWTASLNPFSSSTTANTTAAVDTSQDTYINITGQLAVGTETITLVHAYAVIRQAN